MADFILNAPKGANKKKFIVGRGSSSGNGTTAGKGNKGQQSRSGGKTYAHRGFSNYPFKKEYSIINVCFLESNFESGETVDKASLLAKNLIDSDKVSVKILGNGELTKKLTVNVDKVSASAKAKIEKAGGSVVSSSESK